MLASGAEALSRRGSVPATHRAGQARLDGTAADQRRDYARCGWTPWSPLCDRPSISLGIIITAASPTIT